MNVKRETFNFSPCFFAPFLFPFVPVIASLVKLFGLAFEKFCERVRQIALNVGVGQN